MAKMDAWGWEYGDDKARSRDYGSGKGQGLGGWLCLGPGVGSIVIRARS